MQAATVILTAKVVNIRVAGVQMHVTQSMVAATVSTGGLGINAKSTLVSTLRIARVSPEAVKALSRLSHLDQVI